MLRPLSSARASPKRAGTVTLRTGPNFHFPEPDSIKKKEHLPSHATSPSVLLWIHPDSKSLRLTSHLPSMGFYLHLCWQIETCNDQTIFKNTAAEIFAFIQRDLCGLRHWVTTVRHSDESALLNEHTIMRICSWPGPTSVSLPRISAIMSAKSCFMGPVKWVAAYYIINYPFQL